MDRRAIKKCQQLFQVFLQTGHRTGSLSLPAPLPLLKQLDGCRSMVRLVNELGLLQAVALRSFEFVFQVAQLVRPAALVWHRWPEPGNGVGQAKVAVGRD